MRNHHREKMNVLHVMEPVQNQEPIQKHVQNVRDVVRLYLHSSLCLEPVSYTHLDVYKRQALGSSLGKNITIESLMKLLPDQITYKDHMYITNCLLYTSFRI